MCTPLPDQSNPMSLGVFTSATIDIYHYICYPLMLRKTIVQRALAGNEADSLLGLDSRRELPF